MGELCVSDGSCASTLMGGFVRWLLAIVLATGASPPLNAQEATPEYLARQRLPDWVQAAVVQSGFERRYTFDLRMNPFFVEGDLDRDGRRDAAIWVRDRRSDQAGIAIVRRAGSKVDVIGAGTDLLRTGAYDFSRMDIWRVVAAADYPKAGIAAGDLLYVEKSESGGGLISWDGSRYRWTQFGD
jgi:hypothetical protein